MIFSNKNFIDPNQVGLDNYYITYCKLHISKSRDFLETVFKDYFDLLFKNDKNPQIKKIINKCFKNGIKLDLPILKIKGKSKDDNWLFNFEQNKIIENVDVYDFLISNEYISIKDKSKLDILLFQSLMADLILLRYKKHEIFYSKYLEKKTQRANDLSIQYHPINEVENIIHRGYVFKTQISRFLMLSYLFNKDIFYNLNIKTKLTCYQEFQKLSVIGKKTLATILIKNKNEEAIFNLLKYGLKLNWDIVTNEGKKNLIAFEMLYSLKWVKTIIEHKFLDIRLTNLDGENILHLIGSGALEDISIENSLRRKINELNKLERENLFFQTNAEGLTPLMKSVIFQDEKLIDFIISFGIKPWDIVKGSPLNESAMDFLNNYILSKKTSEGMLSSLIDIFKETFWYGLAKKWNSEYYYLNLKENLKLNNKESPKKIKI